jgi:hypothetical protein
VVFFIAVYAGLPPLKWAFCGGRSAGENGQEKIQNISFSWFN